MRCCDSCRRLTSTSLATATSFAFSARDFASASCLSFASTTIHVSAQPVENRLAEGQTITVPVAIDVTNLPERVGSYTAVLSWNENVLSFKSFSAGSSEGFTTPVVNNTETKNGRLIFAAANPHGLRGAVNILNVTFEVSGAVGSDPEIELKFTAMAAAKT